MDLNENLSLIMFHLWAIAQMQQALVDAYAQEKSLRELEARYGATAPEERVVKGRIVEPPALPPPSEE